MRSRRILLRGGAGTERTWLSCGARPGRGRTVTALRPVGVVELEGKCYEAVAAGGEWLPAGVEVVVSRRKDGGLVAASAGDAKGKAR
jgi:membrane-bound ClpP family serine protease